MNTTYRQKKNRRAGYLELLVFLLMPLFIASCGLLFGDRAQPGSEDSTNQPELAGITAECSANNRCPALCKKMFNGEPDRLDKCLTLQSSDVGEINAVYSSMEKGSWSTIKPAYMKVLVEFDDELWPEFAKVNEKAFARNMLLWVAKQKEAAELLDEGESGDDGDSEGSLILKNAFSVLGLPAHKDKVVIEGMKQYVDDSKNKQNFFQVSAFNKNDEAFKAGYTLLKAECEGRASCMKKFYCDIDEDIVFGRLNSLDLGSEIEGGGLYKSECDN